MAQSAQSKSSTDILQVFTIQISGTYATFMIYLDCIGPMHMSNIQSFKSNPVLYIRKSSPKQTPCLRKSSHPNKGPSTSQQYQPTSTTRHLCHCMGFLTSFRTPVLHGVDRSPHPNDQNFLRPTSKKNGML